MSVTYTIEVGTAVTLFSLLNPNRSGLAPVERNVKLIEEITFSEEETLQRPGYGTTRCDSSVQGAAGNTYVFDLLKKNYEGNPYQYMMIPSHCVKQNWD